MSQTNRGPRLTYLSDPIVIADTLHSHSLDTLALGNPANRSAAWAVRHRQPSFDHIVLAAKETPDQLLGLLTAVNRTTQHGEPFVLLDNALFAASAASEREVRRMIAMMIVRIVDFQRMPMAIVSRTQNPDVARALHTIGDHLTAACFYPAPEAAPIPLATAAFAYRIARAAGVPPRFEAAWPTMLGVNSGMPCFAVLDLRAVDEDALVNETRKMYQARPERQRSLARPPDVVPMTDGKVAAFRGG